MTPKSLQAIRNFFNFFSLPKKPSHKVNDTLSTQTHIRKAEEVQSTRVGLEVKPKNTQQYFSAKAVPEEGLKLVHKKMSAEEGHAELEKQFLDRKVGPDCFLIRESTKPGMVTIDFLVNGQSYVVDDNKLKWHSARMIFMNEKGWQIVEDENLREYEQKLQKGEAQKFTRELFDKHKDSFFEKVRKLAKDNNFDANDIFAATPAKASTEYGYALADYKTPYEKDLFAPGKRRGF